MCHNSPILAFLQSYLPQKKANDKSNLIVDSESYSVLEQLKCTKWFPFDSVRVTFAVNHNCGCLIQAGKHQFQFGPIKPPELALRMDVKRSRGLAKSGTTGESKKKRKQFPKKFGKSASTKSVSADPRL